MDFKSRYKYNTNTDILGKGGFARVYKAYDTLLDREVAIKVFNQSDNNSGSVLNEIRKAINLRHPNLMSYYDVALLENVNAFGETEKMEIGIMEYANYGDLRNFIRSNNNRDSAVLIKLLKEILSGLVYLHSKGIIHRDLKPQNILLSKEGDILTAKISDFGISKAIQNATSSDSALMGTIGYMAPEQFEPKRYGIDGRIGTNLDVWAFGVMVYELLTDKQPFGQQGGESTVEQIMKKILSTDLPADIESIPDPFRTLIKTCLVADARARTKNCADLIPILDNPAAANIPLPTVRNTARINLIVENETMIFEKRGQTKKIPEAAVREVIADTENKEPGQHDEPEEKSRAWIVVLIVLTLLTAIGAGVYLYLGRSIPPTYKSAKEAYATDNIKGLNQMRILAYAGSDSAARFIGDYYWGHHLTDSAFVYYKGLADRGAKGVNARIGQIYFLGKGNVPKDDNMARQYFEKAATDEQDTAAYFYLSQIYYFGRGGVTASPAQSFRWAQKAAEAGSVQGQFNLASLYFNGEGVEKNYTEAMKWYTKAAGQNNGQAKFIIGFMYETGKGVPVDLRQAASYYREAIKQGIPEASEALKRVSR